MDGDDKAQKVHVFGEGAMAVLNSWSQVAKLQFSVVGNCSG